MLLRLPARPLLFSYSPSPHAAPRLRLPATATLSSASSHGPVDDDELDRARKWLAALHADTIPKSIGELSFSRSSGPGGQNVNK